MSTTQLKQNKYIVVFKFLIPSFLILVSIFALSAAWRGGNIINLASDKLPNNTISHHISSVKLWKILCIAFAFIATIISITTFALNQSKISLYICLALCVIFLIALLVFSFLEIHSTTTLILDIN